MKRPSGAERVILRHHLDRRRLIGALSGSAILSAIGGRGQARGALAPPDEFPSSAFRGTPSRYSITDLGTLPDAGRAGVLATDVNTAGWVVGSVGIDMWSRAFLWRDGVMADLGAFPGTGQTEATAINDNGQVVGQSGAFEGTSRAFLWEAGKLIDLGGLPGTVRIGATGINNAGDVVGTGSFASVCCSPEARNQPTYGFLYHYRDGSFTRIGTLGGDSSWAYAINDSGSVVGGAETASAAFHAFIYRDGELTDLGTLPGDVGSVSLAITSSGYVVGRSGRDPKGLIAARPFLFNEGQMIDLGALPGLSEGVARDVNAAGMVVGSSSQGPTVRAFRYDAETGIMTDLNDLLPPDSGWVLTWASAINELGQIVGTGMVGDEPRAFLLTPSGQSELPAERDLASAAATAAMDLSELELAGEFDALYDRMHPDAQVIVPRAAVVGWYETDFAPQGLGPISVMGVRFVDWTWPVTGKKYLNTAEVSYRQQRADGSSVEDVIRLVRDEHGIWRWFFGRDRAFVEEQIARFDQ